MAQVAVVGAGVVGLSTAVCIQESIPGISVTIIADKFNQETTSDGAAGVMCQSMNTFGDLDQDFYVKICRDTFEYFDDLIHQPVSGEDHGVQRISGYVLSQFPIVNPVYKDFVYHFHNCSQTELASFSKTYKYGVYVTTLMVSCRQYLPWMMSRFKKNGGIIIERKLSTLRELSGQYDIIVNCSGLGSRNLVGDDHVRVMRGQTIRVDAPWIKHFYVDRDRKAAVYACQGSVLMGATRQLDNYSTELSSNDRDLIRKQCTELVPSLTGAKVLWEWVGLRPYRETLRLERETCNMGSKSLQVIHNYGHGPIGIALSWGSALAATRLVQDAVRIVTGRLSKL